MKASPGFFTRVMTNIFAPLIKKNEIITYIDDILIQVDTKNRMFDPFLNFRETLGKSELRVALDKHISSLGPLNFWAK